MGYPHVPYPVPVPAPGSDPDNAGDQVQVCFSASWLPYIVGALKTFTATSTWQGDKTAVQMAQDRADLLISIFAAAAAGCGVDNSLLGVNNNPDTGATDYNLVYDPESKIVTLNQPSPENLRITAVVTLNDQTVTNPTLVFDATHDTLILENPAPQPAGIVGINNNPDTGATDYALAYDPASKIVTLNQPSPENLRITAVVTLNDQTVTNPTLVFDATHDTLILQNPPPAPAIRIIGTQQAAGDFDTLSLSPDGSELTFTQATPAPIRTINVTNQFDPTADQISLEVAGNTLTLVQPYSSPGVSLPPPASITGAADPRCQLAGTSAAVVKYVINQMIQAAQQGGDLIKFLSAVSDILFGIISEGVALPELIPLSNDIFGFVTSHSTIPDTDYQKLTDCFYCALPVGATNYDSASIVAAKSAVADTAFSSTAVGQIFSAVLALSTVNGQNNAPYYYASLASGSYTCDPCVPLAYFDFTTDPHSENVTITPYVPFPSFRFGVFRGGGYLPSTGYQATNQPGLSGDLSTQHQQCDLDLAIYGINSTFSGFSFGINSPDDFIWVPYYVDSTGHITQGVDTDAPKSTKYLSVTFHSPIILTGIILTVVTLNADPTQNVSSAVIISYTPTPVDPSVPNTSVYAF